MPTDDSSNRVRDIVDSLTGLEGAPNHMGFLGSFG